ncbi:MAG: hypothetical protein EPO31_03250 [Gammaproteobacteria bacterium]|nr:MAG: hypothetical protein EPO31_03250 [Gammaproteobacteria bacterium]
MLDALAAVLEAFLFAGLLSCTGAVFAEATLGGSSDTARFAAQVIRRGALLTIVAGLAGSAVLVVRLGGRFDQITLSAVFLSIHGAAFALQTGGALLLLASVAADRFTRSLRIANAGIAILSFAYHGHAWNAGTGATILAVGHITAAAWWIGSLWLLERACSRESPPELAALVRRFGALAGRAVGGLLLAGLILAMLIVSSAATPLTSPYLRLLVLKIGLVAGTLGLAAYNKYRLTPRLMLDDIAAAASLRSMIRGELVLIGAVLAATAFLTTVTSPFREFDF